MIDRKKRRQFGQNYLKDPAILFEMGEAINVSKDDKIFEIGPGMGALTNVVIKDGVEVTAMDIDPANIEFLEKKMREVDNVNFLCGDIMKADLEFIKNSHYRIIGNLPYNISTQIIIRLLELSDYIKDMHFLVQKEVAEKICGASSSKNWGKLSIKIGLFFNSQKLFDVPPESFDIKPKVDSSFIRLTPVMNDFIMPKNKNNLFDIIDMSFSTRRKNIKNNLKKLNIDWSSLQLDPSARAEDLSIQDFVNIALNLEK
jgi:16S rRNA (adenine1518-N6/adenine1519-N6)-dimethyltransferase